MAERKVRHTRLVKNLKLGDLVHVIKYSLNRCDLWGVVIEEDENLVDLKPLAGMPPEGYDSDYVYHIEDWVLGADKWWRFTIDNAPDEAVAAYAVWRMGGGDAQAGAG